MISFLVSNEDGPEARRNRTARLLDMGNVEGRPVVIPLVFSKAHPESRHAITARLLALAALLPSAL